MTLTLLPPGQGRLASESIAFADRLNGWIYGARTYVTHDGGRSWKEEHLPGFVSALTTGGGAAWATVNKCGQCAHPRPYVAHAASNSWSPAAAPPGFEAYQPLIAIDAKTALADGYSKVAPVGLFLTTNAGKNWRAVGRCKPELQTDSVSATALDTQNLWLICGDQASMTDQVNYLYRSSDGGVSWQLVAANPRPLQHLPTIGNLPNQGYIPGLTVLRGGQLFLTPRKMGLIARSDDGGTTWTVQLQDDGGGGYVLQFVSESVGFALSVQGLYRTLDGGWHWSQMICRQRPCLQKP